MTNYIATWLCADEKGEESKFPQTGMVSSSTAHQAVYWRCTLLFFTTSKRFNKTEKHLFFTNLRQLPMVDGLDMAKALADLGVEVIHTDFKYKTPKGYFGMFQNQFYEFSILEYLATHYDDPESQFMVVDSDCIFLRPAQALFSEATKNGGFLSFEDGCTEDLVIHGLSRKDMRALYEELLGTPVDHVPGYHLGEFFLASHKNLRIIFADFLQLWPEMLRRHNENLPKFHEEAQTLSFIYYKNNFKASRKHDLMKRIWTNPVFYRNVDPTDVALVLWHLPAEKTFGLFDLYRRLVAHSADHGASLNNRQYHELVEHCLGIPYLSPLKRLHYYTTSYYRALSKRVQSSFTFNNAKSA